VWKGYDCGKSPPLADFFHSHNQNEEWLNFRGKERVVVLLPVIQKRAFLEKRLEKLSEPMFFCVS